ncbi:MAG: mechanosensitive ion channel family protein [Rhodospirillales bacterium]|nr:mechanosensitive ion channel family protein [Rhodospirillales bacterium]
MSLFRWLLALTALVLFAGTFGMILAYTKLPEPLLLAFGSALQWIVIAALLTGVWVKRDALDRLIGIDSSAMGSSPASLLARHWHLLFAVGLIGMGLFATASRLLTDQPQAIPIIETLLVAAAVPAIDGLLRMAVRHLLSPIGKKTLAIDQNPPTATGFPTLPGEPVTPPFGNTSEPPDSEYAPVILRNLRIVLAVLVVLALGGIWNIDIGRLAAGSLGTRVADALFTIVIALLLASALWGVVKTAIDRHVPRQTVDPHAIVDGEGGHGGLSRLQTLLPIIRKFLFTTIVVMVGMTVISALGVDIGPLLAGAGVVGIAIGFGAQALVRDIVSGIFFLIDDAFRVGEYIDVGAAKGTVERISIRSLRLRHHLGQINTIPFGEIKTVTNYSRDWAIMKLELRVPLDTDIEKVRKLVKRVGQEMQQDPELAMALLQSPKSQGVHRMEPSAYVVRVKYMAKPGEQFTLRREVFRRLQEVFRENGIRLGVSPTVVDAATAPPTTAAATGRLSDETATSAGA